jgi:hypothetical protein
LPPGFGGGELLVCLCGIRLASMKKATVCVLIISMGADERKKRRNGQESGIVVRGGRVTLWRTVEALIGERAFELVEWW